MSSLTLALGVTLLFAPHLIALVILIRQLVELRHDETAPADPKV